MLLSPNLSLGYLGTSRASSRGASILSTNECWDTHAAAMHFFPKAPQAGIPPMSRIANFNQTNLNSQYRPVMDDLLRTVTILAWAAQRGRAD